MALFKKNKIDIGTIDCGQQGINVLWEFEELNRSDIAVYKDENNVFQYAIEKTCTCQGSIEVSDRGITMIYNDKGLEENKPIERQITVYLADPTKNVRVNNERGVQEFNQTLGSIKLYIEGIIS